MYKPYRLFYLFIIYLLTNFLACKDDFENYSTNPQNHLSFSVDTLSFDTVLTTVNSPVLAFRVYNKNSKPLFISSVQLAEGANSVFKINVDGRTGSVFENVEILAKDSLLVLVNVKPKENGQYTPTIFTDYVIFETNGVQQKVVLEAYGQDVCTLRGAIFSEDSVLDNQKPYLIYDSIVIERGVTVEIKEGSVFYMYNNAQLIVRGTIKIKGSLEKPVIFRGSRTDYMITIPYDLIPGQWGGIYFDPESYDNEMENVRIRNGKYGMYLDVSDDPSRSKLYMKNVVLTNVHGTLLQAVNCNITAENCEFSNSRNVLLDLTGGSSRFTHCTIVNYYPFNKEKGWLESKNEIIILADSVFNVDTGTNEYYPVISAEFYNSIIWGAKSTSTSAVRVSNSKIPCLFKNCLIPNDKLDESQIVDCVFRAVDSLLFQQNPNKLVKDDSWYPAFDFRLRKDSPVKDIANFEIASQLPYDLNGFYRFTDGLPDLGAYEYYEEEE